MSCQSSTYALDMQTREGCQTLYTQPRVGIQASDPFEGGRRGGEDKWQPNLGVPGTHPVASGLWERGKR